MPLKTSGPFSEFHEASAPEPSGTSQGICTGTLRNFTKHLLRRNPPEPHKVSALEPSGTSQGICPGTLRNLTTHLHLDPSELQVIMQGDKAAAAAKTAITQGDMAGRRRSSA